ncbi:MAG: GNAT family N-acetyltransferase [Gammaproteobacteria bacterium]|nr:GNAT family N-acetyltransferase [Gammaproteobacteria bacterium]
MDILAATAIDADAIRNLILDVAAVDILPHFNDEGRLSFLESVLPDVEKTLDTSTFYAIKAMDKGQLVGFAALKNGDYLTHLFVAKRQQGVGLGKRLLAEVLAGVGQATRVSLRASVNAVSFYETNGFIVTGEESQFKGIRFVPMSSNEA